MKSLLILGAGLEQSIAIKTAKEMGLKVIAVDGNPSAPGLKIADIGINANIKNIKEMIEIGKKYHVKGVFVHGVEIPQIVAKVAKALNLPGLDPETAERATNKLKRIRCFTENGVPCPRFETARTLEQAKTAAKKIGFPCVFKPADNCGARGVKKIQNILEIDEAYKEAIKYSKESRTILIEEFLEGNEISTESVIYNGKIITTGFGDRNYSRKKEFDPYFVEDGHNVPSTLDENKTKNITKIIEKAIKTLGINWGVAKGDVLIDKKDHIFVLEMAARTSGGWFAAGTVPIATGINILKPLITMAVGEKIDENDLKPKWNRAACQRYIIPTESGIFKKISGIKQAKKMPGVKMFVLFNKPKKGDIIKKSTNHAERFGQLITEGNDILDATIKCENAMKKINIEMKKK